MFDLKRPCSNCPFRKSKGALFALHPQRLVDIFDAPAFQCHKTLEGKAQQCAGLMSVLHKTQRENAIMKVARQLTNWRPENLDHSETYDDTEDAMIGHNP